MRVVIAIDSFKGSMTSEQAGLAAARGVTRVFPAAQTAVFPVADGGEGTAAALMRVTGATPRTVRVTGPLGSPADATYGVSADGTTAYMEMAAAAGLPLVQADERDPLRATTYGVGEMMLDAIACGCSRLVLGIGGSATNDGGAGMLQALGFGLYDDKGNAIGYGAAGLEQLAVIDDSAVPSAVRGCEIRVACDVTNPLCGERGASAVYGPQKGADAQTVARMDRVLRAFAALTKTVYPQADDTVAGAGAAGGLGFALHAFLGANLVAGSELVLAESGLEAAICEADFVLTGEGRLDGQTAMGKTPVGVARLARRHGKPVIAFAGGITQDAGACHEAGIDAFFPLVRGVCTLDEAMAPAKAQANMSDAVEQVFRVIHALGGGA